jgi:hypothetical protein
VQTIASIDGEDPNGFPGSKTHDERDSESKLNLVGGNMRLGAKKAFVILTLALFTVAGPLTGAPHALARDRSGLELLGVLPHETLTRITLIDAEHRRAYGHYYAPGNPGTERLIEYDLDRPVAQMPRRDVPLPSLFTPTSVFNPPTVALNSQRRVAWYLDWGPEGVGSAGVCPAQSLVRTIDLVTLKPGGDPWDLNLRVPGFYAEGIAYSATDRRIYVTGVLGCQAFLGEGILFAPILPVTILALDADTGALAWSTTLTKCLHSMSAWSVGAPIYRSDLLPALYVGCMRPDNPYLPVGVPYPGQAGIDRVWIDPTARGAVARFREEFFAISGNFANGDGTVGQLLFDPRSERLFLATHSVTTPGAWVFDGRMNAWVGFVPAVWATNSPIGVDPSTGHFFMRSGSDPNKGIADGIIVSDASQTPVTQGRRFDFLADIDRATWVVDPARHVLFVSGEKKVKDESIPVTYVLRDTTPTAQAVVPENYDALTSNVSESARTLSTYSGTTAGYGANVVLVGGTGGAIAPVYQGLFSSDQFFVPRNSIVSPGDRGATLASVPFLDLRNVGASATAQQIAPDTSTDNDRRTYQNQVAGIGDPVGQGDATAQAAALLDWRWPSATCLDPGGDPTEPSRTDPGGEASSHCDLDKLQARASANEGAVQTDGLTIAGSSVTSSAAKDATGLVTTTIARVRGLHLEVPDQGALRIGDVRLEVRTLAHGHAGTARVSWSREIKDAVIADGQGNVLFACAVCDPDALARQVNDLFDLKLRMHVPTPEITQTPRGAFAGFAEDEADHVNNVVALNESNSSRIMPALQLEFYNDFQDRSRILLQLAGIQANSIYGITPLPAEPPVNVIPVLPTIAPLPQQSLLPAAPPPVEPPGGGSGGIFKRLITTARFLVRSPKDALLVGLTGVLLVTTAAIAFRRRQLNALTMGGPAS